MKWLARLVALAMLGLAASWFAPSLLSDIDAFFGRNRDGWKLELVPQATIAVTYVAERERWLSFPVTASANRIRIISNANLYNLEQARAARTADPRKRWRYALDIEVVDSSGEVILRRRHHHRTDIAELRLPDQRLVTPAFYLNEPLTPVTGVVITLNLSGLPQAARLRIRAADLDADVADIAVRAYYPEPGSERQAAYLWQRLSERQKATLAKGSVYAHELLTDAERLNLLHNQWQPAGAQGARDEDFHSREMYVLRDVEAEPVDDPIPPAGIIAAPGRPAMIAVPEQGGRVRFEATPLDPIPLTAAADTPQLNGIWYGDGAFARDKVVLPLHPDAARAQVLQGTRQLGGGLLELEAAVPMALRAFIDIDGVATEITPERLYQRVFIASASEPVSFAIAHDGTLATPIRLEARYLLNPVRPAAPPTLRYEFLDADARVLRSAELAVDAPASRYDEAINPPPGTVISDWKEWFFAVPAAATELRVSVARNDATPVLVALATRPTRLPRQIRAPEDRFDYDPENERIPAWFSVRPNGYPQLISNNRSQLVTVQPRPPREHPELLTGRYLWEDFRPTGRWLARQLLTPREAGAVVRDEALVSTFSPLASGRARRLDFPPWLGLRQLTPAVLWVAPDDTPFSATLMVDGRAHHVFGGHGRFGEIHLPPLPAGRHEVRVELARGEGARPQFFINLARAGADAYTLRLASRSGGELAFDIERTSRDEETITARLFQPAGWRGRSRLTARIEGPAPAPLTPLAGWLFDERHFDVRPDPSWTAPVFDTRGEHSDAGQPVFVVIPAGAPTGRYRIIFRSEAGPAGYLAVSRITPGTPSRRRIFEEAGVRNVSVE